MASWCSHGTETSAPTHTAHPPAPARPGMHTGPHVHTHRTRACVLGCRAHTHPCFTGHSRVLPPRHRRRPPASRKETSQTQMWLAVEFGTAPPATRVSGPCAPRRSGGPRPRSPLATSPTALNRILFIPNVIAYIPAEPLWRSEPSAAEVPRERMQTTGAIVDGPDPAAGPSRRLSSPRASFTPPLLETLPN